MTAVDTPATSSVRVGGSPASIRSRGVVVVIAGSGTDELGLGRVAGAELGVPVAAAVDGQLGDAAAAHLAEQDLAVGDLFAVSSWRPTNSVTKPVTVGMVRTTVVVGAVGRDSP